MDEALKKLAAFENTWGPLIRWGASFIFVSVVWCLLKFGDAHYVRRAEFIEINGKLDSLVSTVTQDAVRLEDVQNRLHRIENLQDDERGQDLSFEGPGSRQGCGPCRLRGELAGASGLIGE